MEELIAKVKERYNYLTDIEVETLVDTALGIYYTHRYPFDEQADEIKYPITSQNQRRIVLLICDDLAQRNGFNNATTYRENGVSISFDGAIVSERIVRMIIPCASIRSI